MFALGDAIGRRFFAFVSLPHRLASAFLCGLLFSSWWTYVLAYMFSNTTVPMVLGQYCVLLHSYRRDPLACSETLQKIRPQQR
jgi:hypothetical protein